MIDVLEDPADWHSLKSDDEWKNKFIMAFKKSCEQLNLIQQYYQYKWDDVTFGIDEHTWLNYIGAYKNLVNGEGTGGSEPEIIKPLIGKTKLAGTQVIDAASILSLIGSKVSSVNGVQHVDEETLRIIYEDIQELSAMGEDNKANLLKEFVDKELVPGNLPSNINFDESFEIWKQGKIKNKVNEFSVKYGINSEWFIKVVNKFLLSEKDEMSYKSELNGNVDFNKAEDKSAGNRLKHMMLLKDKLPEFVKDIKRKYI